jgi:ABC-2 type transport system permease protein
MTTRPYIWSVRRELWEYRSIWIAPSSVAVLALVGFFLTLPGLAEQVARLSGSDVEQAHNYVHGPYGAGGILGLGVAFLVGAYYCLDALYGERRDRSVLFWKSLPVSDSTTVLAKATIPLVVLPLVVFVVISVAIALMALISMLVLDSADTRMVFHHVQPMGSIVALGYVAIVLALWHAPIYGWLLFVSGRARRSALLWAVVPLLAIGTLERILFQSWRFFGFLRYLLLGWIARAFEREADPMTDLIASFSPVRFLSTPSLWLGIVFAAVCLAGAIQLRRRGEPL